MISKFAAFIPGGGGGAKYTYLNSAAIAPLHHCVKALLHNWKTLQITLDLWMIGARPNRVRGWLPKAWTRSEEMHLCEYFRWFFRRGGGNEKNKGG